MTLIEQWDELINNQTDDTIDAFWKEYSDGEISIYTDILANPNSPFEGTISDLTKKYNVSPVIFTGFLSGIETSLNNTIDLASITEESEIKLDIDLEKLYYNMHVADAKHLYSLEGWNEVLSKEKRASIEKEYKKSKTVVKEKKIGRNEPCPCGSGKKYKHCCGR